MVIKINLFTTRTKMKRILPLLITLFTLMINQHVNAANNGLLFDVLSTGAPVSVSISLCLNGRGPISCQNYNVSASNLSVLTTVPNHTYPIAGIKINTPGYTIENLGVACIPIPNGYCLFTASNLSPALINIKSISASYIGGTLSGLTNDGLILQNNGSDDLSLPANTTVFQFSIPVTIGSSYNVTVLQQPSALTCTVTNGAGTSSSASVNTILVTCNPATYTIGGVISGLTSNGLELQNNNNDLLSVPLNSSTFQFFTPVAAGGSYQVSILQQPEDLLCTVSNGSGVNVSANISTVNVTCLPITSAYIVNNGPSSISSVSLCAVDGITGQLSNCAITIPQGVTKNSYKILFNSSKTLAYIVNARLNNVTKCEVNPVDGNLINCSEAGSGFTTPLGLAFNSTNKIAYVTNVAGAKINTVSKCSIDPITGNFNNCTTAASGLSFPSSVLLNSNDTLAYVTISAGNNSVAKCTVDNNGDFINCTPTANGTSNSRGVAIDPTGQFAYVSNFFSNTVSKCDIASNGDFISCIPTGSGFSGPFGITLNSTKNLAYVACSGNVLVCNINVNGSLSGCTPSGTGLNRPVTLALY